jgi:hypothetical protein
MTNATGKTQYRIERRTDRKTGGKLSSFALDIKIRSLLPAMGALSMTRTETRWRSTRSMS